MDNTIQSDLIRGHIDTIILKALYDGDRYGFDIIKEIEQKSSGQYILKQPTLYSCLKRLEVQGFIKSYWGAKSNGGRRKYYTLTDMGKDLFIKNQSEWVYSRTVIDKLISDKDFDWSTVASENMPAKTVESENEELSDSEKEQSFSSDDAQDENADSELTENTENEQNSEELADIVDGDNLSEELAENAVREKFIDSDRPYLDTTAIMNEIFEKQLSNGSYTEKLKTEKYVPSETLNPNDYFSDNYFDETPLAKAVPDIPDYNEESKSVGYEVSSNTNDFNSEADDSETSFLEKNDICENQEDEPLLKTEFYSYDSAVPKADENAIVINREYKNILCDLRDRNIVDNTKVIAKQQEFADTPDESATAPTDDEEESFDVESDMESDDIDEESDSNIDELSNDKIRTRNFKRLESDIKDLGDGVKIRTHNSSAAKEYANTYYFYSNKLMLSHFLILFITMLLEISVTFFAVVFGSGVPQKHAIPVFIIAVAVALMFPLTAFILNLLHPEKKKRISFNFRISMVFRTVVMLEALVLVYTLNLILNMPLTFAPEYLVSLLIPAIMATNIPVSAMIFQSLYKSGKYSVID
ncbi:MAG: hypothetical protein HFE48_07165 [Clostridia bacterium]|nr:hypothetical protein [Clostridia bacterium]